MHSVSAHHSCETRVGKLAIYKTVGDWGCRAEARKEQLAKAAEEMRESGKTASAFSDSQYAVSEDKSPNVHTRQVNLCARLQPRPKLCAMSCVVTVHAGILQEEGVRESAN